jgi:predicted lipoprotein with Yx(FWY)xxD motif
MNGIRLGVASAALLSGFAVLTACGSADANPGGAAMGQPGHIMLETAQVAGLGQVVANASGMTLYRYEKDMAAPPTSNCNDACNATWKPFVAGEVPPMLEGVQETQVGTVTRKDGSKQLTLNGWPLYLFAKDTGPGQANGQGANGTWFAITPDGGKASGTPAGGAGGAQADPNAAPADGGSGY